VRKPNPSYAALAIAEVPPLRKIRAQLDDATLLLEISLGEERSFLWLAAVSLWPIALSPEETR
jgi:hypothetical protein